MGALRSEATPRLDFVWLLIGHEGRGAPLGTTCLLSPCSLCQVIQTLLQYTQLIRYMWDYEVYPRELSLCSVICSTLLCPSDYITKLVPSPVPCLCSVSYCVHISPRYTTSTPISSLTLSRLHPALAGPIPSITSFTFLVFSPSSSLPNSFTSHPTVPSSSHLPLLFVMTAALPSPISLYLFISSFCRFFPPPPLHLLPAELPDRFVLQWLI